MTTTLADRMRARMKELELRPLHVAEAAGVGRSFVYDILRGRSADPSSEKLTRVAAVLQMPIEALLYDEDGKQAPAVTTPSRRDYVAVPFVDVEADMGGGAVAESEEEGAPWHFPKSWLRGVLRLRPAGLRLIRVRGDSMEPTLLGGDVVMLDTTQTIPNPTGIFVLHDGFGLVAKRLERLAGGEIPSVRIISDNSRYSPYDRSGEEIRIIGRIVWFARNLS
ncbi:MAG: helix-turn-helix domain-containing protein [Magnetospirillum sp.]|jgi:phage repressor protein C with HTH and peptisase S24 domain|uniref:Putative transcriptional regulator n=1 Tax=Paramagnetospirillum magnetotacticum MS-1 TaxID=272627 RepID=A0A0C2YSX7_PARME|nr:S24 family peptidase [Paramagnetospirillum magnetotacticum]KIL98243.1 putative transcriptional regulator [Paramagnetospirillum magnetotacticum MS-1]MBI3446509.1 helix-turn-helix domain-containing protein [Magnetospirillum sp.]